MTFEIEMLPEKQRQRGLHLGMIECVLITADFDLAMRQFQL